MTMHYLPAVAAWTLAVVSAIAFSVTSAPASQAATLRVTSAPDRLAEPSEPAGHSVAWQMEATERRARVDMILYRGRFDEGQRAAVQGRLDALALTYPGGR